MNRRNLIWLFPLLLFLSYPLWRGAITTFLTPRGGYESSYAKRNLDIHNFNMNGIHITQSDQGKITLDVHAKRAFSGKTATEIEMEEVEAIITDSSNEQIFVNGHRGKLDKQKLILTLIDNVIVMKPSDSFELYSDLLIFNDRTHIAHSPGQTKVIGEKIEITGKNLIFNTLTQAYDLSGRVRCKLTNFSSQ